MLLLYFITPIQKVLSIIQNQMKKQNQKPTLFLYEDQTVQISQNSVKVLKFYFPQDSSDEISFGEINKLGLREMDEMDEIHGVDPLFFKDFNKRVDQNKNMYIQMATSDESVRLCFAPDQPLEVMKIIEKKWEEAKIGKQKKAQQALKENNLYANVDISQQKMKKAVDLLNKSEQQPVKQKQNVLKRDSLSSDGKADLENAGEKMRKKVKQSERQQEANQANQLDLNQMIQN